MDRFELKHAIQDHGWDIPQFANIIKCNLDLLHSVLQGRIKPTEHMWQKILQVLGMPHDTEWVKEHPYAARGQELRKARQSRGYSQAQAAAELKLDEVEYVTFERGLQEGPKWMVDKLRTPPLVKSVATLEKKSEPLICPGEKVKAFRERHGLTQAEMAHLIDLADNTLISKWETGRKPPSLRMQKHVLAVMKELDSVGSNGNGKAPDPAPVPSKPLPRYAAGRGKTDVRLVGWQELYAWRTKHNLSKERAAEILDVYSQAYSEYERGKTTPQEATQKKLRARMEAYDAKVAAEAATQPAKPVLPPKAPEPVPSVEAPAKVVVSTPMQDPVTAAFEAKVAPVRSVLARMFEAHKRGIDIAPVVARIHEVALDGLMELMLK